MGSKTKNRLEREGGKGGKVREDEKVRKSGRSTLLKNSKSMSQKGIKHISTMHNKI